MGDTPRYERALPLREVFSRISNAELGACVEAKDLRAKSFKVCLFVRTRRHKRIGLCGGFYSLPCFFCVLCTSRRHPVKHDGQTKGYCCFVESDLLE